MQFLFGNINRLRGNAVEHWLHPVHVVGLPQFGYASSVISYEKSTACFPIILILAAFRHISFIDTFIVMYQDGRNVNSIRARHAALAVVARYGGVLHHQICRIIQILSFLFCEWYQWRVSTDVKPGISHAAQHRQYILGESGQRNAQDATQHGSRATSWGKQASATAVPEVRAASAVPQYGRGHWRAAHPAEAP